MLNGNYASSGENNDYNYYCCLGAVLSIFIISPWGDVTYKYRLAMLLHPTHFYIQTCNTMTTSRFFLMINIVQKVFKISMLS